MTWGASKGEGSDAGSFRLRERRFPNLEYVSSFTVSGHCSWSGFQKYVKEGLCGNFENYQQSARQCLSGRDNLFFFFFFFPLNYLFLVVLGLRCCARAFSSCGERGLLCCGAWASHCSGFSCCRARALGAQASVVVARGLSSCGARA